MSSTTKTTLLQNYNMVLYRTALHPEFFGIQGRSRIKYGPYEFEAWVFHGGHVLRFEHGGLCVSELITEDPAGLPERGQVTIQPCAGERDYESEFADIISYMTSMQTESLSDHLYRSTYRELLEHGRNSDALMSIWTDSPPPRGSRASDPVHTNLSMIDTQRYNDEIHVQGYHLRSDCGLVLRTQSIFQVKEPKEK